MVLVGQHDVFEQRYRAQFRALLVPYGQLVSYDDDRAALDVGLHLYGSRAEGGDAKLTSVRVWFQCKGMHAATIPADVARELSDVAVDGLPIETVRFWYAAPEPVYLAVYLESIDEFFAEDIRDIVDRRGGIASLNEAIANGQATLTLRVRLEPIGEVVERLPSHRSFRADGPPFRGRPLGHRYDPLRSELDRLAPEDFASIVLRLLEAHEFHPREAFPLEEVLQEPIGGAVATLGSLYLTYEWTLPLLTQYGYDPDSGFRVEAPPEHTQGDVLVVVHSEVTTTPQARAGAAAVMGELQARGVSRALVFFNAPEGEAAVFAGWRAAMTPLISMPQGLGSLAFNVLTATNVYLEFLQRLRWRLVNYL